MKVKLKDNFPEGFTRFNILANQINSVDPYLGIDTNSGFMGENFYREYLLAAKKDLGDLVLNFAKGAQIFSGSWMLADYIIIDDLRFDAYATTNSIGKPQYCISLGVLLAFDDLFFRFLSDKRFFYSHVSNNFNEDWPDIDCMWIGQVGSKQPNIRFEDYRIVEKEELALAQASKGYYRPRFYGSALFEAIPVNEPDKIEIAASMTQLAISWIILHEETHYLQGHLNYLRATQNNYKGINEKGNKVVEKNQKTISRLMEWQADKFAAQGMIDVFLSLTNLLPKKFSNLDYDAFNTLRLIMTSAGCATLIFERVNIINGASDEYPSPRTRLITIIMACFIRTKESQIYATGAIKDEDMLYAWLHSLHDVMGGSIMLPKFDSIRNKIDRLDEIPNELPKQNLEYIKNHEELFRVFKVTALRQIEDNEDREIQKLWSKEQAELIEANDSFFYEEMKPYANQAMKYLENAKIAVSGSFQKELSLWKKLFG